MKGPTIYEYRRRGRTEYRVRAWENGKRVWVSAYATLEAAERGVRAYLRDIEGEKVTAVLTVSKWVEEWLDARKERGVRSERSSRALWKAYVETSKVGGIALRSVKQEHVREWLHDLRARRATIGRRAGERLAEQTLRNALHLLGAAFRDAVEAGKMRANVAHGIRIETQARSDDRWTYLSLPEIETLFACAELDTARRINTGVRSAFTVAIYAGLREGELWGLRWQDVHLGDSPHVVVRYSYDGPTKTGKIRTVPLLPPAATALKAWREHMGVRKAKGLVWPGKGGAMAAHGHDAGWSRIRVLAGLRTEVRFHDLRHTCASHLVSGSWGRAWRLEEVCALLGHADLKTTQRYAHLSPEAIMGAAREASEQWNPSGTRGAVVPIKRT